MFNKRISGMLAGASLMLFTASSLAEIQLPRLISDGIVLQRDVEGKLWGWSDKEEKVVAFLNGKPIGSAIAKNGEWSILLPPQKAGGAHELRFEASNSVVINDVYFGDVWVASGQSNMQTTMARVEEMFPEEVATANIPLLRQFTAPRKFDFTGPKKDYESGTWELTNPTTVRQHSAVAYFFGKKILNEENVPIGILSANMGGSMAECWMSEDALKPYKTQYQRAISLQDESYLNELIQADREDANRWYGELDQKDLGLHSTPAYSATEIDDSQWSTLNVPEQWDKQGLELKSGIVWFRKAINLPANVAGKEGFLRLGTIIDADQAYVNGVEVGNTGYRYPPRRYSVNAGILKPGKNTIAIRVRVNHGGGEFVPEMPYYIEANGERIALDNEWKYKISAQMEEGPKPSRYTSYNEPLGCYNAILAPLFNMPIKGVIWYQGESNTGRAKEYETVFPHMIQHWREQWGQGDFPFLFVQLANYMTPNPQPSESGWAELRFSQLKSLSVPNTAMAVTIDVGNWNDLHPMDKKSVGERLALAAQALAYGKDLIYSGPIIEQAKVSDKKVILSFDHIGSGLMAKDGELGGFAIKDKNGQYVWAKSEIKNNQVIVWHPEISNPSSLRYAWAHSPEHANLYNKEGLPASPFEVDLIAE